MKETFNVTEEHAITEIDIDISQFIHTVRGRQVIMDSDLAMLYQVVV